MMLISKHRRKAIYGKLMEDIDVILHRLCEYNRVEIIEGRTFINHIDMLVKILAKISLLKFMRYLKVCK